MKRLTREEFIEACKKSRWQDSEVRCILSTATTEGMNAVLVKEVLRGDARTLQMMRGWSHVYVYTREEDREKWIENLDR